MARALTVTASQSSEQWLRVICHVFRRAAPFSGLSSLTQMPSSFGIESARRVCAKVDTLIFPKSCSAAFMHQVAAG